MRHLIRFPLIMVSSHSRLHFKIFFGVLLPFFPFEIPMASLVQVSVRKEKLPGRKTTKSKSLPSLFPALFPPQLCPI